MSEKGYIMLCYSWKDEKIVVKIWERLEQAGYRVWIDRSGTDGMKRKHKSIYIEMAKAVKNATVVFGCLSKAYQDSENCLREGNMIGNRKKDCIPIIVEKDYKLEDWVETIFGGQIYIDFSNAEDFDNSFDSLLLRLKGYTDLNPNTNEKDSDNTPQHAATINEYPGETTEAKRQYFGASAILFNEALAHSYFTIEDATNKLMDLAKELGDEWKQLGIYLGFKKQDLFPFEKDSGNNIQWAIFSMLDHWYKNAKVGERYAELTKALIKSDRKDLIKVDLI